MAIKRTGFFIINKRVFTKFKTRVQAERDLKGARKFNRKFFKGAVIVPASKVKIPKKRLKLGDGSFSTSKRRRSR